MTRIFFIIIGIVALFYVTHVVRRNKLPIKESFWWLVGAVAMLSLATFPQAIDGAALALGISYPPTLLLTLCVIFLLFLLFKDGRRISRLQAQNIELEQQIALIKNHLQRANQKDNDALQKK